MSIQDYFTQLRKELEATPFKERGKLIAKAASERRVTKKNIYEHLRKAGYESGRKKRSDFGSSKVSEELAMRVAGYSHLANRDNNKRIMPVKLAVEILEANGEGIANNETGEVAMPSVTTINRVMKNIGCHPSQLIQSKPAVGMRSAHVNHTWQQDWSVCVLYHLPSGEVAIMEKDAFYKNKLHNLYEVKDVTIGRYIVIDHYSGAFYVHYSEGAERSEEVIKALVLTMSDRGDKDPLRGIPKVLIMDKGSGNTSGMMRDFCESLGIELIHHAKGNPRAKGAVEQCQNLVETTFEGRLRFTDVANRDELQALCDKWRIHFCARKAHTRHKKTRFDMWNSIAQEHLVMAPSAEFLYEQALLGKKNVKVNARMVITLSSKTYGSHKYDVSSIPDIRIGEEVEVCLSPFNTHYNVPIMYLTRTLVGGQRVRFDVLPIIHDEAGFNIDAPVFGEEYNSKAKTIAEKMEDKILKSAYGVESIEEAKKLQRKKAKPYQGINAMADIGETSHYFKKQASDLVTKEEIAKQELPPLSTFEIGLILRKKCPAWARNPDSSMAWLEEHYPNGVTQDKVKDVIQAFNEKDMKFAEVVYTNPSKKIRLDSDLDKVEGIA